MFANRKTIGLDLAVINILTAAFLIVVSADVLSWLRVIPGIPVIILFPGYVCVGALYPGTDCEETESGVPA